MKLMMSMFLIGVFGVPSIGIGWEIQRELGRGAFGTVYLATDPQLERAVALKVLHFGTEENSKSIARFLRDAKAAACLRHPNIVAVPDAGRHKSINSPPWVVSEKFRKFFAGNCHSGAHPIQCGLKCN